MFKIRIVKLYNFKINIYFTKIEAIEAGSIRVDDVNKESISWVQSHDTVGVLEVRLRGVKA